MSEQFEHLRFERESLTNPRRRGQRPFFQTRDDKVAHGKKLHAALDLTKNKLSQQQSSRPNALVLKLYYEGTFNLESLQSHGLEFISQDGNQVCLVFSNEVGIAQFSDHLQRLGLGEYVTNGQLLEALTGIDQWSPEDRYSWALRENGIPNRPEFPLDVELWPLGIGTSKVRNDLKSCFEKWLTDNHIDCRDKVNIDSLLMYRVVVTRDQCNLLLNHTDVRLVDLPPRSGIAFAQLSRDINTFPTTIPSAAASAPRVCILDSGINTNHPLLRSAIAESRSFVNGEDESGFAGHGTAVARIALFGDREL